MHSIKRHLFILETEVSQAAFADALPTTLKLDFQPTSEYEHQFFDTFDWRLYDAELILERFLDSLQLSNSTSGILLEKWELAGKPVSRFAWELPDRHMQHILGPILGERALMPVVSSTRRITPIDVKNSDGKTVVRLQWHEYRIQDQDDEVHLISLSSIRGYDAEAAIVHQALESIGAHNNFHDPLFILAPKVGRKPLDYSSRLELHLTPEMSLIEACQKIFQQLLSAMLQNHAGMRDDIDTEFLHDYRVAIRRTRSALSLIKGIFQREVRKNWQTQFSYLGKMTNRLRDLDVYLLSENQYRDMLPLGLQNGLNDLFTYLAIERKKEFTKFNAQLKKKEIHTIQAEWQLFIDDLTSESAPLGKNAQENVFTTSQKLIFDTFRIVAEMDR